MAVGTYALITLAELQEYPGIPASPTAAETSTLEALIDGASAAFEAVCHALVRRTFAEDYTWEEIRRRFRPDRDSRIWLKHYPIVSVTSITDPDSKP